MTTWNLLFDRTDSCLRSNWPLVSIKTTLDRNDLRSNWLTTKFLNVRFYRRREYTAVNLSFSVVTSTAFLPVHLQRALSTVRDARKKQCSQNSHHFPNVSFQATFSLPLHSFKLMNPIICTCTSTLNAVPSFLYWGHLFAQMHCTSTAKISIKCTNKEKVASPAFMLRVRDAWCVMRHASG